MNRERRDHVLSMLRDEVLGWTDEPLTNTTSLFASGRIDSMSLVQVVDFVERKFGIEADPVELTVENFDTVENIDAFVSRKLA